MNKVFTYIKLHKMLAAAAIFVVAGSVYYLYQRQVSTAAAQTRYVTAAVERGTVIASVSGTGQVSVSNQVDVKPKVAGDLVYLGIKDGQEVKAGTTIARLDTRDAEKAVRDAQSNLDTAKLALQKLQQPPDVLSTLQGENAIKDAENSKQKAIDALAKAYDDGFNNISNAFLDLPTVMSGLQDILYTQTISKGQDNISAYHDIIQDYDTRVTQFKSDTVQKYTAARTAYDRNLNDFKSKSRSTSSNDDIASLVDETYETSKLIADAVKSTNDFLQFVKDRQTARSGALPSQLATHQASLTSYTGTTNTHLLNLYTIQSTIKDSKNAMQSADRTIAEKTESLKKLKSGTDPLDIQSQQLTIKQRQNALSDVQAALADYIVRVPFDGIIAKVSVKNSDSVSAGTAIATLITRQKIAEVSLNEVDIAKIKVGEKATLTFDAIENLSITGQVAELDTIGTVTSGVVNYTVKISFDTQDERIKPGMSVSAAIITDIKQNVLTVPNAAIKTQGGTSYVQVLPISSGTNSQGVTSATPPTMQAVEVGLASDTVTEITSGANEGDHVVVRTVNGASASQAPSAPSLFGPGGGGRTGAGGTGRGAGGPGGAVFIAR